MEETIEPKKRKPVPEIWTVLRKARKIFDAQLVKSNETKLLCINNQVNGAFLDVPKFWGDYLTQTERLLNNLKYLKECKRLKVSAKNLSEHIVFLGSATINKVLNDGVESTLGKDLTFYSGEILTPEIREIFRNEDEEDEDFPL